ncbi:unnamed protein product [Echinostoma caproni]|uniref:BPI2 domain-containing protein n=1 Tax=Echinostoma caproni TaxID=27848 RepID=A0A183A744_9TREM|nr:unnamed protein product [Echinostoma caproni]
MDFLAHHGLTVDTSERLLLDSINSANGLATVAVSIIPVLNNGVHFGLQRLLDVSAILPPVTAPVTHTIVTRGPPVHCRARRLVPDKLPLTKREFDVMLRAGIIHPSLQMGPAITEFYRTDLELSVYIDGTILTMHAVQKTRVRFSYTKCHSSSKPTNPIVEKNDFCEGRFIQ